MAAVFDKSGEALEQALAKLLQDALPGRRICIASAHERIDELEAFEGFLIQAEPPDVDITCEDGRPVVQSYPVTVHSFDRVYADAYNVYQLLSSAGVSVSSTSINKFIADLPDPLFNLCCIKASVRNGQLATTQDKRYNFSTQFVFSCFPLICEEVPNGN